MKKFWTFCAILVLALPTFAATIICGEAKDYAGQVLKLQAFTDQIAFTEKNLATAKVDSLGRFEFVVKLSTPISSFIPLGNYVGNIFLEPNKKYTIALPPRKDKTLIQNLDPYFAPTQLLLQQVNPDMDNINTAILSFDVVIDRCFTHHMMQTNKDSIEKTISLVNSEYKTSNRFLQQYYDSQYLLLKRFSPDNSKDYLIDQFIKNIDLNYGNRAFWEVFNALFVGFFSDYKGTQEQLYFSKAINNQEINVLFVILERRYGITNRKLQELVVIRGLYDAYFSDQYNKDVVFETFGRMIELIKDPENRKIYFSVIRKMHWAKNGSLIENTPVALSTNEIVDLKTTFKARYVYINFCNENIEQCKQDLIFLEKMAETYKDYLQVVNVFVYESVDEMNAYVERYQLKNLCVNWNNNHRMIDFFNLRFIPSYVLADGEGAVILSHAPTPDENFDFYLEKLINDDLSHQRQKDYERDMEWLNK
ncbi:MAG: hypothetical protein IJ270_01960 [Paludibacteraceae bacterium]|nr:hypothetical protein [Paludibacteraceae bacterium]